MARSRLNADDQDGWVDAGMDVEDLHQWCARQNRWTEEMGIEAWYMVTRTTQGTRTIHSVVKVEGVRSIELRAKAAGKPVEWYRAPPEDAASIHEFVRKCMDQGMEPWEFRALVKRTGGAPRITENGKLV